MPIIKNEEHNIKFHNLELDEFQIKAVEAINNNKSVLVSAPTGAGKTLIAEFAIEKSLKEGKKIIYTAPIKALSNQKYREFKKLFPDDVGIITGDVSISPDSPLLIMTTEIFKNRIIENRESFKSYSWIIFDEIHYIDDMERGRVWEESLIFIPESLNFIGLSATIPNIFELADWIYSIHSRKVEVIIETKREVPLNFYFYYSGRIVSKLEKLKPIFNRNNKFSNKWEFYKFKRESRNSFSDISKLLKQLKKISRTPAIYFTFSRKRAEELAKSNGKINFFKNENESEEALKTYDELCEKFDITDSERAISLRELIENGVAYHHAGLLPMQKEVIEQLFSRKLIRMIFTTETFALGINMPAKTVIIDSLKKRYGKKTRLIKIRDFFQMSGRAGRRGIDNRGFVYSFINPLQVNYYDIINLQEGKPEPVTSKFNADYSTILNLYEIYGDNLTDIYELSFHYFQSKKRKNSFQLRQMKSKLKLLKELQYIKSGKLTEKGNFAKKLHGYGLVLSELYSMGVLEKLDYKELAVLSISIVYDSRTRRSDRVNTFNELIRHSDNAVYIIQEAERFFKIKELSKACNFSLSRTLIDWMRKIPLEEILEEVQVDEGEIIRYYRMGIQVMRELLRIPFSDKIKHNLKTAIDLIDHGIVDAENQLNSII